MRRFILTTTMALSILMSGTANIGYAKEGGFGDVTGAVLYYEDIQRLNDMGVLSGYDDGNFYPDNKISVAEGITIAEKVFGGEDTLPAQWDDWFNEKCGWMDNIHIDRYLFLGDFSKNMSYETAAEVVIILLFIQYIDNIQSLPVILLMTLCVKLQIVSQSLSTTLAKVLRLRKVFCKYRHKQLSMIE